MLPTETVPLAEGLGRTLAQDLKSRVDHPSLDNSALDGYACRAADTADATRETPVTLRLVGDIPPGAPSRAPSERAKRSASIPARLCLRGQTPSSG